MVQADGWFTCKEHEFEGTLGRMRIKGPRSSRSCADKEHVSISMERRGVGYVRIEDKETPSRSVLDERRLTAVSRSSCSSESVGKVRPDRDGTSNKNYRSDRSEARPDSVSGRRKSSSGDDEQFFES